MNNGFESVTGLRITKFVSKEATSKGGLGTLQIVLEADKNDVRVSGDKLGELSLNDVVGALTMHQIAGENVILQLRFPEED